MCCKTCVAFFCKIISGWWGRKCRCAGRHLRMPARNLIPGPRPNITCMNFNNSTTCSTTNCSSTAQQRQPNLDPTAGVITRRRKIPYGTLVDKVTWYCTCTKLSSMINLNPDLWVASWVDKNKQNNIFLFGSTCSLLLLYYVTLKTGDQVVRDNWGWKFGPRCCWCFKNWVQYCNFKLLNWHHIIEDAFAMFPWTNLPKSMSSHILCWETYSWIGGIGSLFSTSLAAEVLRSWKLENQGVNSIQCPQRDRHGGMADRNCGATVISLTVDFEVPYQIVQVHVYSTVAVEHLYR